MGARTKIERYTQGGVAQQWDVSPIMRTASWSTTASRVGADNPKFKTLIKQNADATNFLTSDFQNLEFEPGHYKATWQSKAVNRHRLGKTIETRWLQNVVPFQSKLQPDVWFQDSVSNRALVGIIKKIRKFETSDFAGPTFVGELRETISMIRNPLKSLRLKTGLFTDLHMRILRDKQAKGGRFKPEPWRKVISDTWLEWTFGASPLIADIAATIELYQDMKHRMFGNSLKRLSYRFQDSYIAPQPDLNGTWEGTDVVVNLYQARTFRSSAQYVVWIDQNLFFAENALDNILQMSKIDLGEIIPTAWELLPWSFLVDYWTNIGDVMGSTFDYNREVAFGKLTTWNESAVIQATRSASSTYAAIEVVKPTTLISRYTLVRRNKVSKLGFPQLEVSLPSLGQFQNMAALMSSLQSNNPFKGHTLK